MPPLNLHKSQSPKLNYLVISNYLGQTTIIVVFAVVLFLVVVFFPKHNHMKLNCSSNDFTVGKYQEQLMNMSRMPLY